LQYPSLFPTIDEIVDESTPILSHQRENRIYPSQEILIKKIERPSNLAEISRGAIHLFQSESLNPKGNNMDSAVRVKEFSGALEKPFKYELIPLYFEEKYKVKQ